MGASDEAFVTLATNDSYCKGALVLGHSLKQSKTSRNLVVIIGPLVSNTIRHALSTVFNEIIEVDVLNSHDTAHLALLKRPELGITFTKIHCWTLTQYTKCVFMDADTLVLQNIDELFERDELSAAPDSGWPDVFNSGVFVYKPCKKTYEELLELATKEGSFDGGDQGLLNTYFSSWAHTDITKHLPFLYNLHVTLSYTYAPAFKRFGKDAKVVHFIGESKPWNNQQYCSFEGFIYYCNRWRDTYNNHVKSYFVGPTENKQSGENDNGQANMHPSSYNNKFDKHSNALNLENTTSESPAPARHTKVLENDLSCEKKHDDLVSNLEKDIAPTISENFVVYVEPKLNTDCVKTDDMSYPKQERNDLSLHDNSNASSLIKNASSSFPFVQQECDNYPHESEALHEPEKSPEDAHFIPVAEQQSINSSSDARDSISVVASSNMDSNNQVENLDSSIHVAHEHSKKQEVEIIFSKKVNADIDSTNDSTKLATENSYRINNSELIPSFNISDELSCEPSTLAKGAYTLQVETPAEKAVRVQNEIKEHQRAWESGYIDYLGRDSFDNILSRLNAVLQ